MYWVQIWLSRHLPSGVRTSAEIQLNPPPPAFRSTLHKADEGNPTVLKARFAQTTSDSVELMEIDVCFLL